MPAAAKKAPAKKAAAPTTPAQLRAAINKRFGADTVMMASDPRLEITRLRTGILSLDLWLHGGFPRNRHIELFGSANVGKTYLTYRLIAACQALGLRCAFFDVEKTYDPVFAAAAGVDINDLDYIPQRVHGNKLIDIMETYLRSGMYDVVVLDSIASLLPKGELEKDMEAGSYGTEQAKMMSAALRRLTAANEKTVICYINQTRDSIGSMFAAAQRTSGGRAMGFYAAMRLELVLIEKIKAKRQIVNEKTGELADKDVVVGHRVLVRMAKNKSGGAAPESQTTFVFDYKAKNIDVIEDLIYCGRVLGWVHKQGDYWWLEEYESEKKNGRTRFKKWLKDNPEVCETLTGWIESVIGESDDEEEQEEEEA